MGMNPPLIYAVRKESPYHFPKVSNLLKEINGMLNVPVFLVKWLFGVAFRIM